MEKQEKQEKHEKENFCTICQATHFSPKWYNSEQSGMLICKNEYLKQYYLKNKEVFSDKFKTKYKENDEFRKRVNEKNKENDKKRRSSGYKRIRKPRSEWTKEEQLKAK